MVATAALSNLSSPDSCMGTRLRQTWHTQAKKSQTGQEMQKGDDGDSRKPQSHKGPSPTVPPCHSQHPWFTPQTTHWAQRVPKEGKERDPKARADQGSTTIHTHGPLRCTKLAILHECSCRQTAHEKTSMASVPSLGSGTA